MKYFFYLFCLIIVACSNQTQPDTIAHNMKVDTVVDFNLPLENNHSKKTICDIVDSVEVITLETSNVSVLHDFYNFEISDNYVYILDQYKQGSVAIFNRDGSFVKRIPTGQGPEDINKAWDITFDKKRDELIVYQRNVIKKFSSSGSFVSLHAFPYAVDDMISLPSGDGYVIVQRESSNSFGLFTILWVDSSFAVQRVVNLPLRTYVVRGLNPHLLSYDGNGNINLSRAYDDNVYLITDTSIHIKKYIDFSSWEAVIPEVTDIYNRSELETLISGNGYAYNACFCETDNYEFYSFFNLSRASRCFYRYKRSGLVIGPISAQSLIEATTYNPHSYGNYFVAVKEHTEDLLHYERNSEVFSPEQMKILSNHTPDDNPLIILYRLKDIPAESDTE